MKKKLLILLTAAVVFADNEPLSTVKKEILNLKREQIQKDTSAATDSWISPLIFSLSINKNEGSTQNSSEVKSASVNWNQDLFRSGGIYYTIEQSKATGAANLLGVDIQESAYFKQLYTLKAQIERDKLNQTQDELTLKNMDIDLLIIKAKYKAGLSDISELNQATINRDGARTNLIVVKNALFSEMFELKKLVSTDDLDSISLPDIPTLSKEEYLQQNLELLQYSKQNAAQEASWKNTRSAYLPKLTFNGSYGQEEYKSDLVNYNGNAYSYGLTLSIPLDINTKDTIESAKLQYLQTKSSQNDRKLELEQEYEKHINNIRDYREKISVADEMIKMYDELYEFTKQQVATGFKSQYDLESLDNSVKIQKLEKEIQNYNILIEKITLYFDTKH